MLSPTGPSHAMENLMDQQLPKGKTIIDVFADFIRYLFDSTKAHFEASEPNGELRWDPASGDIELVLTHPNGWGGPQQTQLRTAAVRAGIIPDTPVGHPSVRFVTEGEATFNFCATHTEAGKNLKVCHAVPAQRWSVNTLAAWRTSFYHRCGYQNDQYQYLHSSQQQTAPSRRVLRTQV